MIFSENRYPLFGIMLEKRRALRGNIRAGDTMLAVRFLVLASIVGGASSVVAAELEIMNSSGTSIRELYIAAAGQRSWGADRLREKQPSSIAQGESHTIGDLAPGTYQLMLVDADGTECEIDSVDVAANSRLDLTPSLLRECTSSH